MDAKAIVQHPAELKPPPRPRLVKLLPSNIGGPLIGLVLLVLVFSFSSEFFFSLRNGLNILDQVTVLGILAIGMTAVIVIGGIDLSVGSLLALTGAKKRAVFEREAAGDPRIHPIAALIAAKVPLEVLWTEAV